MPLTCKMSKQYLEHVVAEVLSLNIEYPIHNTLIQNECEHIDYLITINDDSVSIPTTQQTSGHWNNFPKGNII